MKTASFKIYLQLLEIFTLREIKSRYKASLLGPLWIVLYPLLTALILNFIFGKFIKIKTEGIPYFLFVLSGLVIWNFFQQGLELAKNSLVWNRELITKTSFAKNTLPLSYILSKIPDFIVYVLILIIFYFINYLRFDYLSLFIVVTLIPLFFFSAGIALISSLANAIFRDFGRIIEFFLMILFYATPILYPESLIPERYKFIIYLNPVAQLIIFTRDLIFKQTFRYDLFIVSLIISLLVFTFSLLLFKKFEKKIADLI